MTTIAAEPTIPEWLLKAVIGLVASAYQAGLAEGRTVTVSVDAPRQRDEDTLTRAESAAFLRCGLTKFDLLVKAGQVPTFKIGGQRYSKRADLQAWLDRQERDVTAPPT